ncbi:MAG: phosphopantetheine-binding protein, partial [Bacteroidota bacterium]
MQQSKLVRQAVVQAWTDAREQKQLVAYIVPKGVFDQNGLRQYLQDKLPVYMHPSFLVEMDALPLNRSGKIDRKALPDPTPHAQQGQQFAAARDQVEAQLTSIWQDVLKLEKVGVHDNFFELGGDSIITIQLASRARAVGLHLQPKDLFHHPSIA